MATIAIAGAASGAYGAKTASDAAEDYQVSQANAVNKQISQTRASAWSDFTNKVLQEQTAIAQARASNAFKIQDARTASLQAQSTAAVSAAEGGVGGLSIGALLGDYSKQYSRHRYSMLTNNSFLDTRANQNMTAYGIEYQNRANSIQPFVPSPVEQPNYIGFGLQAAGGVMGAYQGYKTNQRLDKLAASKAVS